MVSLLLESFHRLKVLCCVVSILSVGGCERETRSSTFSDNAPNVIIFLADDAGYEDFGFQGSSTHLTPNLDEISRRGARFTNAYVSSAVCSPSRAGILTGRYQNRFGVEFNLPGMPDDTVPEHVRGLPASERTLGDILGEAGYRTGFIGKWHLGQHGDFHPTRRGFDEFFGILAGHADYRPGKALLVESNYRQVIPEDLAYLTDAFGDEAVAFVDRHKGERFFLHVSFTAPHAPLHATPEDLALFTDSIPDVRRATNAAMMYAMDRSIGRVMQALRDHNLESTTLVIFTNDNGGDPSQNAASNGNLRGGKGTVLEGGIKVPLVMQWPAEIAPGQHITDLVSTLDFVPTLAAAAGVSLPSDREFDGQSLLDLVSGSERTLNSRTLFWRVNWGAAVRRGDWKLIRTPAGELHLYDVVNDPQEREDQLAHHTTTAEDLNDVLTEWETTLQRPVWTQRDVWQRRVSRRYDP